MTQDQPDLLTKLEQVQLRNLQLERDVVHLVRHDQLTGLLNRSAFVHDVDKIIKNTEYATSKGAMIEVHIRGLPRISGSLGRHVGDYAVSALAARLNLICAEFTLRCRLDYWSFAVFIPKIADPLEALTTAKRILEALSQPVDWVDRKLTLDVGAGVALTSPDDEDAAGLLQNAAMAMKAATDRGGAGYGFYNPAMALAAKRRNDVLLALQDAVENQYMHLHYQPFFKTSTGDLMGFEALMRLTHPTMGVISPAEFIPVAEESGLINKLGAWALAKACTVAADWPSHLTVAVNISPEQFYSGTLITDVHNALELSSFPAYRLEVEVTESTMLKDSEMVLQQLGTLRDMGSAIVLDDFGTGYSSLSYLWKFPFSKMKIDRSFVQALDTSPLVRGMLQSIIGLSRNLGLKITAEGIEIQNHIDVLHEFKCDYIQGYLTGRPASQTDIAAIILRNYAEQLRTTQTASSPPAQHSYALTR